MKKILLFTIPFHGYENIIMEFMRKKGYQVDFFDCGKEEYKKARKIRNPFLRLWNNIYLKKFKNCKRNQCLK